MTSMTFVPDGGQLASATKKKKKKKKRAIKIDQKVIKTNRQALKLKIRHEINLNLNLLSIKSIPSFEKTASHDLVAVVTFSNLQK